MAVLIFNLRNVPDDEAEEVRQVLVTNQIDFYETPPGIWGISLPGLWITDESQRAHAKELLARYQEERRLRARQHYEDLKAQGLHVTLWDGIRSQPLRSFGVLAAIVFILYVSLFPFLRMIGA